VNAAAAFSDVALATYLVALVAGELVAAILAIGLLVMPDFVEAHLRVLSEPLFLACMVATLVTMHAAAVARTERLRLGWSLAGGCTSAAAVMVRYAGIFACGASSLWYLLLPGTLRDRARRTLVSAAPWVVLTASWLIRTRRVSGARSIRSVGAYGGIAETLREGVATVVGWLVPLSPDQSLIGRRWIALAIAMLLLVALVSDLVRWRSASISRSDFAAAESLPERRSIVSAALFLALCYGVVLLASRLFADPEIPFDERLLLPLLLLAMVVAAITLRAWWRRARLPARILCAVLVVVWMLASHHVSSDDVDWAMENGYDLAGDPWRGSALVAWARANGAGHAIYSNWPSAVVLQLGRPSRETPVTADTLELRRFTSAVSSRSGVILAFDTQAPDRIGVDELLRVPGLRRIARVADGSVFVAPP
jgi:hypothetical protein